MSTLDDVAENVHTDLQDKSECSDRTKNKTSTSETHIFSRATICSLLAFKLPEKHPTFHVEITGFHAK